MPRWRPDTCGCVLDVSDDWTSSVTVEACDLHKQNATSDQDHFDAVHSDNVSKNVAINAIADKYPDVQGVGFSFAKDRTLRLSLPKGLDAATRAKIAVTVKGVLPPDRKHEVS